MLASRAAYFSAMFAVMTLCACFGKVEGTTPSGGKGNGSSNGGSNGSSNGGSNGSGGGNVTADTCAEPETAIPGTCFVNPSGEVFRSPIATTNNSTDHLQLDANHDFPAG